MKLQQTANTDSSSNLDSISQALELTPLLPPSATAVAVQGMGVAQHKADGIIEFMGHACDQLSE